MEPSTCPESISDNPKSISDNPKSALGWLSQFAYFLRFHFQTFFEKVDLPQPLWNFVQEQKVTSGDPLLISFFKKVRTRGFFSQDSFEFFDFSSSFLQNFTKTLFFILSLLGVILQRLCSRQVPHVASHPRSLFPGMSDLGKAPAEEFSKPVQPQPQRAQG